MSEDLWWRRYQEAEKQRDELLQFFTALGKLGGSEPGDTTDIVLRQEYEVEMAKITADREVRIATLPKAMHLVSLFVGCAIGIGVGLLW